MLIEAAESPVERPKKQRLNYSGKKKRHTQKTQIAAGKSSRKILCTAFDKGHRHDLNFAALRLTPKAQAHSFILTQRNFPKRSIK